MEGYDGMPIICHRPTAKNTFLVIILVLIPVQHSLSSEPMWLGWYIVKAGMAGIHQILEVIE